MKRRAQKPCNTSQLSRGLTVLSSQSHKDVRFLDPTAMDFLWVRPTMSFDPGSIHFLSSLALMHPDMFISSSVLFRAIFQLFFWHLATPPVSGPDFSLEVPLAGARACWGVRVWASCGMGSNKHMGVSRDGVPQNVWFTMEHPIKMDDDRGYPQFRKPPLDILGVYWQHRPTILLDSDGGSSIWERWYSCDVGRTGHVELLVWDFSQRTRAIWGDTVGSSSHHHPNGADMFGTSDSTDVGW